MKVEEIIEGLNRSIENRRLHFQIETSGHLVLQKTVTPHETFKAYKEYKYILWFVKNRKKYQILSLKDEFKVIDKQDSNVISAMNTEFCAILFDWIGSVSYKQVIEGEYYGFPEDTDE